ncbi:fimbrial protein [Serratia fonticola]|jgi:type 1 fimbria pilin|uniref:fimbrial protein n=1 Tax=Serratia fonticola TaxID=47917 RepID=UPI003AB0ECE8
MNGTMQYRKVVCLLCGMLVTLPQIATGANSVSITVKVSVIAPPPCIINNNQPIEVEFNEVMTTRVDGNNYRKPVGYSLSCTTASSSALKLQVQGNGASFDSEVLGTDSEGLGIKLLQGSNKLAINSWLNFTSSNPPELWAVPVKQNNVTLKAGEFRAGATMKVDYQ